jgi:3-oxoacyl-[acyl-carrier-protein] synthase III
MVMSRDAVISVSAVFAVIEVFMRYAHIVGWGSYMPRRVLTNNELAQIVDTNDEWVYTRTGIRERRIASERETTATLAFEAAARAIAVAGIPPSQVEMIIVATSTPEYIFPSTACRVQDYLGASRAGAFDLSAACSGFVYGLSMAANAIACGAVDNAVVIGAETMSRVLDWTDRATCILFGDGAGAVALKGSSIPGGVLASSLRSDGSGGSLLSLPAVYHKPAPILGSEYLGNGQENKRIYMNGRQVFRFATQVVSEVIEETLEKAGLTLDQVDLIVPHQANTRIIEAAAKKLQIEPERFYLNLEKYGNTSAASIPVALVDAVRDGRLQANQNVVFVGFGGGLTWAASVIKWDVTSPPEMPFMDKEWKRARYIAARGRSKLRRWSRVIGDKLAGSPTPDARLKDAGKKKE